MQCLIIMVIVSATNCKMKIKKNQKNLCFLRGWAEQTFLPRCKHLLNPYVFYLQNLQFHPDQAALLNICSFVQQGMLQFVNICSLCSWLFAACWIFAVPCNKECCKLCTVMHSDEKQWIHPEVMPPGRMCGRHLPGPTLPQAETERAPAMQGSTC